MKSPRRYAPVGGRLQVEWVATFSGLRTHMLECQSIHVAVMQKAQGR